MPYKLLLIGLITCLSLAGRLHARDISPDNNLAYDALYQEIQYPQLRKALDAGQVFLIDANNPETYAKGHIPRSKSLFNVQQLDAQLPVLKNYPIVVYCGGPQCIAWHKAADFASARGYTSVMHYKGGLKDWKSNGDTLASGKE